MVFCKVFYRLFSYVYVFLYLKLFGGGSSTGSRESGGGVHGQPRGRGGGLMGSRERGGECHSNSG